VAQSYWDTIGRPGLVSDFLAASPTNGTEDHEEHERLSSHTAFHAGIVSASAILGTLAVTAAAVALWFRHRATRLHRGLRGQVLPPSVGPQTTLVVTDVQVRGWVEVLVGKCQPLVFMSQFHSIMMVLVNSQDPTNSCGCVEVATLSVSCV
jgi:hypothetical protein